MALAYVDFIAPNVEVCVRYCVDGKYHWRDGNVVRILERYVDVDNDTECVKCIVSFDDVDETRIFKEMHYDSLDEDAVWCFGDKFMHLVEQVKYLVEDSRTPNSDESRSTDEDYCQETDEADSDDEHTEGEIQTDFEDDISLEDIRTSRKKKYSFANNVGATLFMLSPWIASALVIFNARHEIMQHLRLV